MGGDEEGNTWRSCGGEKKTRRQSKRTMRWGWEEDERRISGPWRTPRGLPASFFSQYSVDLERNVKRNMLWKNFVEFNIYIIWYSDKVIKSINKFSFMTLACRPKFFSYKRTSEARILHVFFACMHRRLWCVFLVGMYEQIHDCRRTIPLHFFKKVGWKAVVAGPPSLVRVLLPV